MSDTPQSLPFPIDVSEEAFITPRIAREPEQEDEVSILVRYISHTFLIHLGTG